MNETTETTLVCIGAVQVLAEQISDDEPTHFAIDPDPFLLWLFASQEVLLGIGQDAIKEIGFKVIGSSELSSRIIAMKDGDKSLLPPQDGCYCVVRRRANDAEMGIFNSIPD